MTGSRLVFDQPGTEASTANPFPVTVVAGSPGASSVGPTGSATPALATLAGVTDGTLMRALRADTAGRLEITGADVRVPSQSEPAVPVRQVGQETFVCSFADSGASVLSPDFLTPIVGTGVGYSQASGSLLITTGTNTNAEFLTRTALSWREAIRLRVSIVASQRIANQNLAFILGDLFGEALAIAINSATSITVTKTAHGLTAANVGQSMMIGGIVGAAGVPGRYAIASVPTANTVNFTVAGWPASGSCTATVFGWNCIRLLTTGTTATNVAFDTMRRGWFAGDTTATINTTAAPGTVLQVDMDGRNVYLADTLRASSATLNVTSRASRLENIPDVDTDLYLFVWSYNGTVAPATTTTWTISYVSVERMALTPVVIAGQRAQGSQAAAPVAVVGTPAVTLSGVANGVAGAAAAGATAVGNPVQTGLVAATAQPTARTAGQIVIPYASKVGHQVVMLGAIRELNVSTSPVTVSTTTETTLVAAVAATFNDIYSLTLINTSATGVRVDLRSVAAGAVVDSFWLPPTSTLSVNPVVPYRQATVNTAWTIQLSAAVTDVRVSARTVQNI